MSDRVLYRDGALTDARCDRLQVGVSILVDDGVIRWIRPTDAEEDAGPADGLELVDAGGATFVPGMVDSHSHVTLPGGSHWIDRIAGGAEVLLEVAERNGRLLTGAGVRWARDVGAPYLVDPVDGRRRGLNLGVRDRWRGRVGYPHMRAAGSWLDKAGSLPPAVDLVGASTATSSSPTRSASSTTARTSSSSTSTGRIRQRHRGLPHEIARVVDAAHARGAKVTAHSGRLSGAVEGVAGGVDAIEHGFDLDEATAAEMARRGTFLVSTLAVFQSWLSFGATTTLPRFASGDGQKTILDRRERAIESLRLAKAAGVASRERHGLRRRLAPGEPARLGGRVAGRGRVRAVGGRWRPRRGAAASCSTSPPPARSPRAGPPTSSSSTATRCPTRPPCGGSGGSPGRADQRPAAYLDLAWLFDDVESAPRYRPGTSRHVMSALTRRIDSADVGLIHVRG